jgi:large subunit ribosomal protein L24e
MVKCSFCGQDENFHKGVSLIKNDGSINYFCSSKCRRNALNLGRDKRKVMWTEAYKQELHKLMKTEKDKIEAQSAKTEHKKIGEKSTEKPIEKSSAKKKTVKKAKVGEKVLSVKKEE